MSKAAILIDPARLRRAAGKAVGALKVLANEDRLLLLCQLSRSSLASTFSAPTKTGCCCSASSPRER